MGLRNWLALLSWALRLRWRKGHTRYAKGEPWAGYIFPVIYQLGWEHGSGKVSWWKFWRAHVYVQSHAGVILDQEGQPDVWHTPEAFYARGGGVCRDWATAILDRAARTGVNADALGWLYLKQLDSDNGHIMAAMWVGDDMWLADQNRKIPERASRVLGAQYAGYKAVAWFNDTGAHTVV